MIKLDEETLAELGLGKLPKHESDLLRLQMYETLEMRVGKRLAVDMSDSQLDEFKKYIEGDDEVGALRWLESNFPSYKEIVHDEWESLKKEIVAVAPDIRREIKERPG